jgi:hypothetical protein
MSTDLRMCDRKIPKIRIRNQWKATVRKIRTYVGNLPKLEGYIQGEHGRIFRKWASDQNG